MRGLGRALRARLVRHPALSAERRWLPHALQWSLLLSLLLSLLFHTLLLSLTFGGQGQGLPGLGLPWHERRGQATELSVVLLPAPAGTPQMAPPPPRTLPEPAWASPAAAPAAQWPEAQAAVPALAVSESTTATVEALTAAVPALAPAPELAPVLAPAPSRAEAPEAALSATLLKPAPAPVPALMTTDRPDAAPLITRTTPVLRAPLVAAAPSASSPQGVVQGRPDDNAAAQQRQLAQLETQRQLALVEAARAETARQESARQDAARQELARQETAKQEATRRESERAAQALRQEAESQDAARQAAARQAAARADAAQQDEARREASRRAMGRQLDEEAAKRDAAAAAAASAAPTGLPLAASSTRRGRLFGRTDANAELVLYAEAWARKIQLNMTMDLLSEALKKPHTQPVVTVSVRSDGSVESVVLVRSSGAAEIDEAVQRIVRSQAPYPAFTPALAREFDVIEIRRTWHFDSAIRLY